MAHFAQLDVDDRVIQVIVVVNDVIKDDDGIEQEAIGVQFCKDHYGHDTTWVQTSYSGVFRKNFASAPRDGAYWTYDRARDAFVPPRPAYPSWIFDDTIAQWVAPVPKPTGGKFLVWDESQRQWMEDPK